MGSFMTRAVGVGVDVADRTRARIESHPRMRELIYELRNRRKFADLHMHDIMLADRPRVDAYEAALRAHIRPGDVVVDLGTGTGVLAFLAARQAARVEAIEHGPIIEAAQAVAAANGIENVHFHRMHSRSFSLPEKADVIVHEQIGAALFDEGVVANMADLRDRVLKPGGRILPHRLELSIEPVQLREELRLLPAWQQQVHGIDFSALRAFGDRQPFDYWYRRPREFPLDHFLCRVEPVVTIDLLTAGPQDLPHRITYEHPATEAGSFDGFCVHFRAWFDDEISLSNSPEDPQTSWVTPFLRVEPRRVEVGDPIRLDLHAEDLAEPRTWRWR